MEQYILFDELEKKEARAMALFRLFEEPYATIRMDIIWHLAEARTVL